MCDVKPVLRYVCGPPLVFVCAAPVRLSISRESIYYFNCTLSVAQLHPRIFALNLKTYTWVSQRLSSRTSVLKSSRLSTPLPWSNCSIMLSTCWSVKPSRKSLTARRSSIGPSMRAASPQRRR